SLYMSSSVSQNQFFSYSFFLLLENLHSSKIIISSLFNITLFLTFLSSYRKLHSMAGCIPQLEKKPDVSGVCVYERFSTCFLSVLLFCCYISEVGLLYKIMGRLWTISIPMIGVTKLHGAAKTMILRPANSRAFKSPESENRRGSLEIEGSELVQRAGMRLTRPLKIDLSNMRRRIIPGPTAMIRLVHSEVTLNVRVEEIRLQVDAIVVTSGLSDVDLLLGQSALQDDISVQNVVIPSDEDQQLK
ncbi:hypothetical protein L9F63_016221, partial [Diploptera punctata]